MNKKRSFYTRIGINKNDLNSMSNFLLIIIMAPLFLIANIIELLNTIIQKVDFIDTKQQPKKQKTPNTSFSNTDSIKKAIYNFKTIVIRESKTKTILLNSFIEITCLYHFNNSKIDNCDILYTLKFQHGICFYGRPSSSTVQYAIANYNNTQKLKKLANKIFSEAKKQYKKIYYKDYDFFSSYSPAYKNKPKNTN